MMQEQPVLVESAFSFGVVVLVGGVCLLSVVVAGVVAVVLFMQRGKEDQGGGGGKNVALIVLAVIVALVVTIGCCAGGVFALFGVRQERMQQDAMMKEAHQIMAIDEVRRAQREASPPPGDVVDPVDH